jgi:alpha-glucosidase (family GH31 glycosyl hydrolase)
MPALRINTPPWVYGDAVLDGQTVHEIAVTLFATRQLVVEYLYTVALNVNTTGEPILR